MSGNFPLLSADTHSILRAEEVASFQNYHEAQRAIERLSDAGFPIATLAILGRDVRTVEKVLGKISVGRVFLQGFLSGMWLGLLAAIFVTFVNDKAVNIVFISLLVLAMALVYALMRALVYGFSSHRRGYAASRTVLASHYTLVATENAYRAREILGVQTVRPRPLPTTGPTPFGSRPDEEPKFGVRLNEGAQGGFPPRRAERQVEGGENQGE